MIFDCHTHWGDCFRKRDAQDPARWLEMFARHGVTHALVLPFAGLLDAGKIRADNDNVLAVCGKSSGRMIPFCTVNSWFMNEATAEIERCLTGGFRGIKFHPWLQGQPVNSAGMDAICDLAGGAGCARLSSMMVRRPIRCRRRWRYWRGGIRARKLF